MPAKQPDAPPRKGRASVGPALRVSGRRDQAVRDGSGHMRADYPGCGYRAREDDTELRKYRPEWRDARPRW